MSIFDNVHAQTVNLPCEVEGDAVFGLDRKNWNGGSTAFHSEGALHNFDFPTNTFGDCKIISNVDVTITIFNIDVSNLPGDCPTPVDYFINIATGCPSFAPASCDPSNFIYEAPSNPLITISLPFTNPPDDFQFGDVLSVDIVPVMNTGCSAGQTALSSGGIVIDYEICVTITVDDAIPTGTVDLGADLDVCPGATTMIDAGIFDDYLWSPGGEMSQMITAGMGTYNVTVTDNVGCTSTDEIIVNEFPDSGITFDPVAPTVCDNDQVSVSVNESYSAYIWSNTLTGQTVSLSTGSYDVTITDGNNCTAVNSITVNNVPPPNAGIDNNSDVCNDGTAYNIDALLLAHDAGGNWTDDNGSGVDINGNPIAVDFLGVIPGTYNFTYTVTGTAPCPPDMAIITIDVFEQNNAGNSATEQFCADPGNLDFYLLIGNPIIGGLWSDINSIGVNLSNPFSVNFNGIPAGTYDFQYFLTPNGPCPGQSVVLTIVILDGAFAGSDDLITVCEGTQFDLMTLVNGANDTGTFFDTDGSGALSGSFVNTSGLAGQSYNFTFIVGSMSSPCGQDEAIFTLNIETSLSAGDDESDSFCTDGDIDLFDILTNEDNGGTFVDVNSSGGLSGSILNTTGIVPGTYTYLYQVGDGITCPQDESEITIIFYEDPTYDFIQSEITICEDNCEDVQINFTGAPPFDFPIEVYSAITGNLLASSAVTTNNTVYTFTTCNTLSGIQFANDTLSLVSDSTWFVIIPMINDANCIIQNTTTPDTLYINTVSSSLFQLDTSACITDTLDFNGVMLFNGNDTYLDTIPGMDCDSIINIVVNFMDADTVMIDSTICSGDSIMIEGFWFSESFPTLEIDFMNPDGCDSLIMIEVTFFSPADSLLNIILCTGDSIVVNGTVYNSTVMSGTELLIGAAANGCDSTIEVSLQFSDDIMIAINDTLCLDGFLEIGGEVFDVGNPIDQVILPGTGCDTIVDINLSFYAEADSMITGLFCSDFAIDVNGVTYDINNPTGDEIILGASQYGCDSTVNIDLSFYAPSESSIIGVFCPDFSIDVNGTTYDITNAIGSETFEDASQFGCDSTVTIDLSFYAPVIIDFNSPICDNDSIVVNGVTYNATNTTGVEILLGASMNGCDSIVNIQLTILQTYDETNSLTICQGDSIFLAGDWQFDSGTFTDNFQSLDLCDSIVSTILVVDPCEIVVTLSSVDNDCANESNGSITIDIQSDIQLPFTVTWNGVNSGISGSQVIDTDQGVININDLNSDIYTITILDSGSNILYQNSIEVIDNNLAISGNFIINDSILCADGLGSFEIQISGGQSPFMYNWDPTEIGDSPLAQDVIAGIYFITVTDLSGCTFDTEFTFAEPESLDITVSSNSLSCAESADGQISITEITGGVSPYIVSINNEITDSLTVSGLDAGLYIIDITDANNCLTSFNIELTPANDSTFGTYTENHQIEDGESVVLDGTTIVGNFTFEWMDIDSSLSCIDCENPEASPSIPTSYSLIITDEMGCPQTIIVFVDVVIREIVNVFPNVFSPNGDNTNDEFVFRINDGKVLGIAMSIYDRWGNLIFRNQVIENEIVWDGTRNGSQLSSGVFIYQSIVQYEDGTSEVVVGDLLLLK